MQPLLEAKFGPRAQKKSSFARPSREGGAIELPKDFTESLKAIYALSKKELHDALITSWIGHISMQGLKVSAQPGAMKPVSLKSQLQLQSSEQIFWSRLKSNTNVVFGFQGRTIEVTRGSELVPLFKKLNSGQVCSLEDHLRSSRKKKDLISLKQFLFGEHQ